MVKFLLRGKTRILAATLAASACVSSAGAGTPLGMAMPNVRQSTPSMPSAASIQSPAAGSSTSAVDPFTGATPEERKLLQEQRLYEQKRRVLQSKFDAVRIQSDLTMIPLRHQLEIAKIKRQIAKELEGIASLNGGAEKTATPPPPPPPPPPPKPKKPKGKTHYIGYYESGGQPTATFLTPKKKSLSLSVGDRYGKYRVERITPESVTLKRGKKKWVLRMDEGDYRINSGTGRAPTLAQIGATPTGGMDALKQMLLNSGASPSPMSSGAPPATARPHNVVVTGMTPPGVIPQGMQLPAGVPPFQMGE